jgi:iron complex transport system substrate-binding protein
MLGREVEVNSTQKLVFLGPGALRMGVYLGLQDRLVGIERTENTQSKISPYRSYLGKSFIAKLPVVSTGGPGKMPNLEALIVHKPDLIITSFLDKTQLELIRSKTSIPVLSLSYGASYGGTKEQLESMKNSILLLGEVSCKEKRARKLVDFIEKKELELSKIELEKKCVYVGGIGYKGKQGITSTEANYPPFELLGLKNCVFKDSSAMGHHFIDYEALLSVDPEMIFVDMFGKDKVMLEQKEKSNFFKALSAYKNKNIKDIHGYNFYATNIENLFVIAYQIASYMGAKNIDVDAKAKEIYDAFYIDKGSRLYESASSL